MNVWKTLNLYIHTLRYLRLSQIIHRLSRFRKTNIKLTEIPSCELCEETFGSKCNPRDSVMLSEKKFRFLNSEEEFTNGVSWQLKNKDPLWNYNLHYFYDLIAENARARFEWHRKLIEHWIDNNSIGKGVGWDAYPISIRIVNWIKWSVDNNYNSEKIRKSLALQTRWLLKNLERDLLANHYFSNGKALIFSGLFFKGEESTKWLESGLQIIDEQINEQILSDGGHFERSPMYHALILEDLLDLLLAAKVWSSAILSPSQKKWEKTIQIMLGWLEYMSHPDGQICFFNDSAFGISHRMAELTNYAKNIISIQIEPKYLTNTYGNKNTIINHLSPSGFIRVTQKACGFVSILDVGEVGPSYNPGHAHADTLSFEMSCEDSRFIVNGGTSSYLSKNRNYERSTAAHSTVEVNGESSSQIWATFRVAKRAFPRGLEIKDYDDSWTITCSHDGYKRLKGSPVHKREWIFEESAVLIRDMIEGTFREAHARFILHPSVICEQLSSTEWVFRTGGGRTILAEIKQGVSLLGWSQYAPYFGRVLKTRCLIIKPREGCSVLKLNSG